MSESSEPRDGAGSTPSEDPLAGRPSIGDAEGLDTPAGDDFEPWLRDIAAIAPVEVPEAPPIRNGLVIEGRYRIDQKLGSGGMGVVYRAFDTVLERSVALKLHNLGIGALSVSRLWREAKAMAQLRHPNVVTVHEIGEYAGRMFIAMEYVEGTVRQWLSSAPRTPEQIVDLFIGAGQGLAAAHAVGIVHRDFKPDNLLVGQDGRARVGDFGVAHWLVDPSGEATARAHGVPLRDAPAMAIERSPSETEHPSAPSHDRRLTVTGSAVGTPAYMAPEQMRGIADARADQFAFCVSLFEALAGKRPFAGRDLVEIDDAIARGAMRPLPRGVSQNVARTLRRGLSGNAEDRFPDMHALLAALGRDRVRGRRGAVAIALVAVSAVTATAIIGAREDRCADADAPVAAIWGPSQLEATTAAISAVDVPSAETRASRVVAAIASRADAIAAMRRETCASHDDPAAAHLVEPRMACLSRRGDELSAIVAVFANPDAEILLRTDEVLALARPVEDCADPKRFITGITPPSADQAATVAQIRASVSRALAWGQAGKPQRAVAEIDALLTGAREVAYGPVLAEALAAAGTLQGSAMATARAGELLREAFYLALREGHDAVMADAATMLVSRVAEAGGSPSEIESWFQLAQAAQDRSHADAAERVRLASYRAHAHWVTGELDAAVAQIVDAESRSRSLGPDAQARRRALWLRGRIHTAAGDLAAGREWNRLAFEAAIRARGPDHPEVANVAESFAEACLAAGDTDDAIGLLRVALDIRARAYGHDSVPTIEALNVLGGAFEVAGDEARAADAYREAIAIVERTKLDDPGAVGRLFGNSAPAFLAVGELDRALSIARRAATLAADLSPEQRARASFTLALVLRAVEGPEPALAELRRTLELLPEDFRGDHLFAWSIELEMVRSSILAGALDDAAAGLARLRARVLGATPPNPEWVGHVAQVDGELLEARGEHARAAESFTTAVRELSKLGDGGRYVTEARLGLARAALASGDLGAARAGFEAVLASGERAQATDEHTIAARFGLAQVEWAGGDRGAALALAEDTRNLATGPTKARVTAWIAEHPIGSR